MITKLRTGEIDCNDQELFFSKLIKGLMMDLRNLIKIRGVQVPHMIINTGDDTMWLLEKEHDMSIEPCQVSNEQYIYNVVPRCIVTLGSMDMVPDQLTNPYVRGNFQIEVDDSLYTLNAEFRRMPIKINVTLKYIFDSFHDTLEMMQHICSKLTFIRTFKITYLGQNITCTYKIPESMDDQHLTEIDGGTTESRDRTIEFTLEVESNFPVFDPKTIVKPVAISHPIQNMHLNTNETIQRDYASRPGYRGPGFGQH